MSRWERFKSEIKNHPILTGAVIAPPIVAVMAATLTNFYGAPAPMEIAKYVHVTAPAMASVRNMPIDFDRFGVLVDQGYVSIASAPPTNGNWDGVRFTGKDGINSFEDVSEGMWNRVTDAANQMMADSIMIHYVANRDLLDAAGIARSYFMIDVVENGAAASLARANMVLTGEMERREYGRKVNDRTGQVLGRALDESNIIVAEDRSLEGHISMNDLLEGVYENISPEMMVVSQSMTMEVNGEIKTFAAMRTVTSSLRVEAMPEAHDVEYMDRFLADETAGFVADITKNHDEHVLEATMRHQENTESAVSDYHKNIVDTFVRRDLSMSAPLYNAFEVNTDVQAEMAAGKLSAEDAAEIMADVHKEAVDVMNDIQHDFTLHVNDIDTDTILHLADIHSHARDEIADIAEYAIRDLASIRDYVADELNRMTAGTDITFTNYSAPNIEAAMKAAENLYEVSTNSHIEIIQMPEIHINTVPDDVPLGDHEAVMDVLKEFDNAEFRGVRMTERDSFDRMQIPSEVLNIAADVNVVDRAPFSGAPLAMPEIMQDPPNTLLIKGKEVEMPARITTNEGRIENLRNQIAQAALSSDRAEINPVSSRFGLPQNTKVAEIPVVAPQEPDKLDQQGPEL